MSLITSATGGSCQMSCSQTNSSQKLCRSMRSFVLVSLQIFFLFDFSFNKCTPEAEEYLYFSSQGIIYDQMNCLHQFYFTNNVLLFRLLLGWQYISLWRWGRDFLFLIILSLLLCTCMLRQKLLSHSVKLCIHYCLRFAILCPLENPSDREPSWSCKWLL